MALNRGVQQVLAQPDDTIVRAARNLPRVKVLQAAGLNVYDVLGHAHLVMTRDALERVAVRLEGARAEERS